MYEQFFGLKAKPFQVSPDPSFIYWAKSHSMTIAMLRYGMLSASPLTVITGEVGSGKTTLLRQLLGEIPTELTAGLISNLQEGKGHLLEWALMAYEQPYKDLSHVERFEAFQKFVLEAYAEGKSVMLIVDEAQNLGIDQLEELRMLSNMNSDKDHLLQIVLVGQPELRDTLKRNELRQFAQRITSDFHLGGLEEGEIQNYIGRRLEVAGATWQVFPAATCALIYKATRGVPRLINVLCDLCLVYGYSGERKVIDEETLRDLMEGIERNGIFNQFSSIFDAEETAEPAAAEEQGEAEQIPFPKPAAGFTRGQQNKP